MRPVNAVFLASLLLAGCDGGSDEDSGGGGGGAEFAAPGEGAAGGPGGGEGVAEGAAEGEGGSGRSAVGEARYLAKAFAYDRSVTEGNILKGFFTSYEWGEPSTDFVASMEFTYVSFADLMPAEGQPAVEAVIEPLLEAAAGRGHHLVLRPYLDYPDLPSGVPQWLVDAGVEMRRYFIEGGGNSPDYEHPAVRKAMTDFIAAFGAAYDGDPRLGIVQLGLLGWWGEWHVYAHADWFPGAEVQDEVMRAYDAAFPTTHLVIRRPFGASPTLNLGFHDDSFTYSTLGEVDWFFLAQLIAAGAEDRWPWVPIGGEIRPELQPLIFSDAWDPQTEEFGQDFLACVRRTHASWMLNYHAFSGTAEGDGAVVGYQGEDLTRAKAGALALGWEMTASEVRATGQVWDDGTASVAIEVDLQNTGIAPFYYPVDILVRMVEDTAEGEGEGEGGEEEFVELQRGRASIDWSSAAPTAGEVTTSALRFDGLSPAELDGGRRLVLSLSSPMRLDGQRMAFANAEVNGDGELELVLELPDPTR